MKKEFTQSEMHELKGCYSTLKLLSCSFMGNKIITIDQIMDSEIPTKDKSWFLLKKCDLTIDQKKELVYLFAESVKHVYNNKYPNDNRVNECLDTIKLYNSGDITKNELIIKRRAAAYAADNAYLIHSAAAAAAAAFVAAFAADAAIGYCDAAYAASYANAAANKTPNIILQLIKKFIKNN